MVYLICSKKDDAPGPARAGRWLDSDSGALEHRGPLPSQDRRRSREHGVAAQPRHQLHRLADVANIAAALRHIARDVKRAVNLFLTS